MQFRSKLDDNIKSFINIANLIKKQCVNLKDKSIDFGKICAQLQHLPDIDCAESSRFDNLEYQTYKKFCTKTGGDITI